VGHADVHVLVPLKRLNGAKTRLAGLLAPGERAELMRAMLADVLRAVAASRGVTACTLVSSEPDAAVLARRHDVAWWDDRGLPWNDALFAAMREAVSETGAAVVSADIPLVLPAELEALIAATPERGAAIARATDGGTNAVSMRPAGAFRTCFGEPGSARLHAEVAERAGLAAVVVDQPGTALDLDSPGDVERFLAAGRPTVTAELLTRLLERTSP